MAKAQVAVRGEGWDVEEIDGYPDWEDFGYREANGNFVRMLRVKKENNDLTHGQLLNFGGDAARIGVEVENGGFLKLS